MPLSNFARKIMSLIYLSQTSKPLNSRDEFVADLQRFFVQNPCTIIT